MAAVLLALTLTVSLVSMTTGTAAARDAGAPRAVRVLFSGDSITQGFKDTYTFRYHVAKEIERQGADVDLVGSLDGTRLGTGLDYADPDFDRDHFARSGTTWALEAPKIAAEVAAQQPDVVYVMLGINDLRGAVRSPETTDAELRTYLAEARRAKPDVRIVVAPVLGVASFDATATPGTNERVTAFNTLAERTVRELSTAQSPLTWGSHTDFWDPEVYTVDGLHPNLDGELSIAQNAASSLHAIGVLPQVPDVWSHRPPPSR